MYPIDPGEQWGEYKVFGSQQLDDYEPLFVREHPDGTTLTRWRLTQKERDAIANGADIFLGIMRFGNPLQPLNFWIE